MSHGRIRFVFNLHLGTNEQGIPVIVEGVAARGESREDALARAIESAALVADDGSQVREATDEEYAAFHDHWNTKYVELESTATDDDIIRTAALRYGDDDIDVLDVTPDRVDGGAWVHALVWIPIEEEQGQ